MTDKPKLWTIQCIQCGTFGPIFQYPVKEYKCGCGWEWPEKTQKEICICAAIRTVEGRLIRCHRHSDGIRAAIVRMDAILPGSFSQGFITSKNRFVTREEGRRLQGAAGMPSVSKLGYSKDQLFSEDLY